MLSLDGRLVGSLPPLAGQFPAPPCGTKHDELRDSSPDLLFVC